MAKRPHRAADVPNNDISKQPQTTRALKACDHCRKQKTRCFKSANFAVSCIRCLELKSECSMEAEYKRNHPGVKVVDGIPEHLIGRLGLTGTHGVAQNNLADPEIYVPPKSMDEDAKRKLDLIYVGVSEILSSIRTASRQSSSLNILNSDVRLLLDAANSMQEKSTPQDPELNQNPPLPTDRSVGIEVDDESSLLLAGPSNYMLASPFGLLSHQIQLLPKPIMNLLELSPILHEEGLKYNDPDIISAQVITSLEAIDLMNDFRSNYGRWVSFPQDVPTNELVERVRRRSPLLLTTCCCISLRYSLNGTPNPGDVDNHRRRRVTFQLLVRHLLSELTKAILNYTSFQGCGAPKGDIEFLQSIVLLSIYSMSLSSIVASAVDEDPLLDEERSLKQMNLDAWHLSGLGLTTFISRTSLGKLLLDPNTKQENESPNVAFLHDKLGSNEHEKLTAFRIYNHLILVHLANCIFSGRMCVLDEIRLNQCKATLNIPSATNFDGRMVSEIGIFLIAYNYIQESMDLSHHKTLNEVEAAYASTIEEVNSWHEQWEYLCTQSTLQFVESTYWFSCILIDLVYNFSKLVVVYGLAGGKSETFKSLLTNPDTLVFVYGYCDRASLARIISHAYSLVNYVLSIDNDSYFAYLSDEIHFFGYFGCVVLLKGLGYLKSNDKLHYLNESDSLSEASWKDALVDCQVLIDKLGRVGQDNPNDILTSYKSGLLECLQQLFPSWAA